MQGTGGKRLQMFDSEIQDLAADLLAQFRHAGLKLATAESCTGGLISAALTEVAGSSDVFERGFVTYSNEAKMNMLRVGAEILAVHGAVSEETARAMAAGALEASLAEIAVAVTGVAGPGGGSTEKPVGLVHIAAGRRGGEAVHEKILFGDIGRSPIRRASVIKALNLARSLI